MQDLTRTLGIGVDLNSPESRSNMIKYINLKLAAMGLPLYEKGDTKVLELAGDLLENIREKNRILHDYHCPVDKRIQTFIENYLSDLPEEEIAKLPVSTFALDRYGLARELSIAPDQDKFIADGIHSYRIKQGVLHNPKNDRRTTKGVFHVVEGGLPVPFDKKEVPKLTFARLLKAAFNAPEDQLELPFTSNQENKARSFVSLLLRPMVCPEVPGYIAKKNMEIRFFVPGNYVCNLDFVESIFGNAGDPFVAANDAGLDPDHWTGYTGCVIMTPHICGMNKKELGLPHISEATERQKRDGMCWEKEDEIYNDGSPFKLCLRDDSGVMVTLIADNYFGYCKKEVKTQIGYAANLYGLVEEEHAGGALATPRRNFGRQFTPDSTVYKFNNTFADTIKSMGENITVHSEGYAVDNNFNDIFYVQENASFDVDSQTVTWEKDGKEHTLKLLEERSFVYPTGLRMNLVQNPAANSWRLVGTYSEGTMCHKPCTVSGGGKSEISKSIQDAMFYGPVFTANFEADMNAVAEVVNKDYSGRFSNNPEKNKEKARSILRDKRSLGSVIKLLNASPENTDEYNEWVDSVPNRIKGLVFLLKRHYHESWGENWREHFTVDFINGELGHEMKFEGRKMVSAYLRVGKSPEGIWRTCKLRMDYIPSAKVQWQDDISASIIVPTAKIDGLNPEYKDAKSVKFAENCEFRFFQRPDDAVVRGYDKQAESDIAGDRVFISNFEPKSKKDAIDIVEKSISFKEYTQPIQDLIKSVADSDGDEQFVSSSMPRIVNGAPTKNPRYLETRKDLLDGKGKYLALNAMRLFRKIPTDKPLYTPVNAVLPGRRNNPAEPGIRPLAVFGPIHYQELPELFADFICSLTGKSPSTTGAGSEGALTKGPFNALSATSDLNNALLGFILTGYNGFSTAAGYIGHKYKVDHDVSLLIPELWSLMSQDERDADTMIENGFLEKIENFDLNGETILGSRLGYRITDAFVNEYLGKVFENPNSVFAEDMLKPELQSMDNFADGIKNICEAQEKVAKAYLEDGSVEGFIPPLKALIHIMAEGTYEGKTIDDPAIRELFTRDYVINSDWYKERLEIKQQRKAACNEMHVNYLKDFVSHEHNAYEVERLGIQERLESIDSHLEWVKSDAYIENITGTLGADPLYRG